MKFEFSDDLDSKTVAQIMLALQKVQQSFPEVAFRVGPSLEVSPKDLGETKPEVSLYAEVREDKFKESFELISGPFDGFRIVNDSLYGIIDGQVPKYLGYVTTSPPYVVVINEQPYDYVEIRGREKNLDSPLAPSDNGPRSNLESEVKVTE